jgi:hypothetical protein
MLIFLTLIYGVLFGLQTFTKKFPAYSLDEYEHTDQTIRRYNLTMKQRLGNRTLTFNVYVNAVFLMLSVSYTFVNSNLFELIGCQQQVDGSYTLLAAPRKNVFGI